MAIIVVVAIIDSIFRSLGHIFSISGRIYSVLGLSGAICKCSGHQFEQLVSKNGDHSKH